MEISADIINLIGDCYLDIFSLKKFRLTCWTIFTTLKLQAERRKPKLCQIELSLPTKGLLNKKPTCKIILINGNYNVKYDFAPLSGFECKGYFLLISKDEWDMYTSNSIKTQTRFDYLSEPVNISISYDYDNPKSGKFIIYSH